MKFADELSSPIRPHPNDGIREVDAGSVDTIAVESNGLLFRGEYLRDGADLIVRGDGETLIVHDYFAAAHRPKLVAPNGASLSDAVIDALARPVDGVEVAQAGAPPASDASAAIGRVQTLSGSATTVRNGVSVALQVGDLVYKGDVVQTGAGSNLAISFLDGTLFSLAASARMVLSEMVYSANGADNHSLFNLVQGSIQFVAGKVAKSGDMKVGTPLATMGIRGTYVGAEITADDGTSRLSVITEPPTPDHPEGYTGAFEVYSGQDTGNLLFRVVDPNAVWTVGPDGSGGVSFRSDPKTPAELAREAQLAQEVFRTLAEAPRLPVYTGPSTGGGAGSGNQPGQFEPNPSPPSTGPGNPGPTLPPGPSGPGPLPPGPTPPPAPNGPDAPPIVTGPSDPATGLTLTPRSVALGQGDVREGLGEQSLLAGAPGAQLIAVRAPASTQDVSISGTVTLQGRYGVLTLHADGTYIYRAVYAAALGEGQGGADVFGLTVGRGSDTATTTLRFDVTGKNDAPVVSGPTVGLAGEDGAAVSLSALARASDVDTGTQLRVVDVPSALPSGVSYDAATNTFRLDPSDASYQSLAAGQARVVIVSYGVSDGIVTTPASVSWVVTGANDAPVVTGPVTGMAREDGAAVRLIALAHAADVDAGTQLSVVDVPSELPPGVSYDAGTRSFRLDPEDATYQSLAAGQTRTVTVSYGVSDGIATTPASVSWTITGANDAPVVTGPVTGTVGEDGLAVRLDALANASDIDTGTRLRVVDVPAGLPPGVSFDAATGTFRLDPSDAAYQNLAAGETRTVTVAYGVSDGSATTPASVSWTVTGVNDAPAVTGPVTGTASEDGVAVRLKALAHASDIDSGTQLRVVDLPSELPAGVSYDAETGLFRLDPSDPAYQSLAAGQTRTVTVEYGISDGIATTPATVTWTVTGANDAPVVTGPLAARASEDGAAVSVSALARASDVDDGAALGVVEVPAELPPGVSYDAATQTFRLDPSNAAYQSFAAGETRTVTVAYGVSDGTATTPTSVSWTVTGVNDAPVVSGPVTGSAVEDGVGVRLGALVGAADVDAGTRFSVVDVPSELPPGVRYDAETRTFLLDPADPAYENLAAGETRTITVGYGVSDGIATTPASASWIVTGTNDAPVVSGPVTGKATEDGAVVRLAALAQASDIDAGARLSVVDVSAELPPGVTYDAATHSFLLDPSDPAFQNLAAGQTRTVSVGYGVSDGTATTPASVSWTVTGTNDAPVVTGAVTGTADEDGAAVRLSALARASDVDDGAQLRVVDVPAALPAGVSYDAATQTFRLDPSDDAYQDLAAGETRTVTVRYGISDGGVATAASAVWTVTGINDAPSVAAALSRVSEEGAASTRLDLLTGARDVDGDRLSIRDVTYAIDGAAPSATIPAGLHRSGAQLTLDPADPAFDALAQGETRTIVVRYTIADGHGGTIAQSATLTVTGTTDAPVVTGAVVGEAVEDGAAVQLEALANASDVDAGTRLVVVDIPSELPPGVRYDAETEAFRLDPSDPAYQDLAAGQTRTVTVGYGVSDGRVTTPATVTWTVTGVNDAPVVTGAVTGAAIEDGAAVRLKALANASDVDDGAALRVVDVPAELPPGVRFDVSTQTFQLDPSDPAYRGLAAGQTRTVTVSYGVSDGDATTPASVSWVVTGANDAPSVSGPVTGRASEDGAAVRLDALARASDVDAGTRLAVVDVPAELPPGVTYDASTQSFRLDPSDSAYQSLAAGQTRTVTVTYGVSDGKATTSASVSWTVTGVNDAPVVAGTVTGAASEDGTVVTLKALANASDVDAGAQLRVVDVPTERPPGVSYDAAAREFRLDPSDAAYQSLAAGQTRTVTVSYGISDGAAVTPASVSWTVAGANDAPVVTGPVAGTASEDWPVVRLSALARASDVDDGASLSVVGVPTELPPGVSYDAAAKEFRLDPSDAAYQNLAAGQTGTVTISYGVSDGSVTTPASVTWTVTGVNDAPVVTGPVTGGASEDGAVVRLSALANVSDVDAGTRLSVVNVPTELPPGVSYDAATQEFRLDPSDAAYQSLAAGQTRTVTVSYGVSDGNATTPASVSWTMTGVNDAPIVSGPVTGNVGEDGAAVRLNALANASDADDGAQLQLVNIPSELPPGVSFDAATKEFRLDSSDAAYQSLAAGQTLKVTVGYGVSDGSATTSASVTWTVTGVNDAPVVTGAVTGQATEDGAAVRLDALANASDVDAGAQLSVVGIAAELPPGVSYDAVTKEFRLDPSDAPYQNLAAGQTRTVTVGYGVSDGSATTPASVSWTVTGVNDAPVVTGPVTGPATEDGAAVQLDALANASDVDAGAQLQVVNVPAELPPGVSYDANTREFRLDPSDAAYQDLAAGQTRTVTVSYGVSDGADTTPATVSWTVTGTNDAPTAGGDRTILVRSGGSVTLQSEDLQASDPDTPGGPFTYTVDPDANPHGSFIIGDDIVTRFTQGDIDAGRVVYHRDDTTEGRTSDTVAFTLDDGAGGVTQGELTVTLPPAPSTRQDNVVRASDDAGGDLDIPIEAILFNDSGTEPLTATGISDPSGNGHIGAVSDRTVTVTEGASTQPNGAFTYRALDADGQIGNAATVFVNVSTAPDGASVAVGAAQDDDVLFASRNAATVLNGADPVLSGGAARNGHDVYVFTQTPPESGDAPIHEIASFSAGNDAIALPFLDIAADGGPVDPGSIDGLVQIRGSAAHGYDLFVSWNLARGFQPIAHFDAGLLGADDAVTVIWNGHSAAVTVVENGTPTVSEPLISETQEGAEAYDFDLRAGASDPDGDALMPTDLRYTVDGAPAEGTPWGLSLYGHYLVVDPSDAGFSDLAAGETRTIVVDYTLDDGHGGTVAQSATITVTGTDEAPPDEPLPTNADNVVLASHSEAEAFTIPVEALLFNDIGADGTRPSYYGITAVTPTDIDRYAVAPSSEGGAVTVSPTPRSDEPDAAFTYRAYDGADRGSEVATVRVSMTASVSDGAEAFGSGQTDDILIASPFGSTTLNGNTEGSLIQERTGRDVFVFTQDPATGEGGASHTITDILSDNDAIDLTFLDGSGASAETIGDYVVIQRAPIGYDLYARTSTANDFRVVAHIDSILLTFGDGPSVDDTVVVIWKDHFARVAVPGEVLSA